LASLRISDAHRVSGISSIIQKLARLAFQPGLYRVNHFEKRKAMKMRVMSADASKPMLAHQNSRVGIMENIANQARKLLNKVRGNFGVPIRCL